MFSLQQAAPKSPSPSPTPSPPPPPPLPPPKAVAYLPSVAKEQPSTDPDGGLQISSSGYQKVRSILPPPPPPPRPSLTVTTATISRVAKPILVAPPTSLVVSFQRRNLRATSFSLAPSPSSEEGVKVTISKAMLVGERRVKKAAPGSRKRERDSSDGDVRSELKKVSSRGSIVHTMIGILIVYNLHV